MLYLFVTVILTFPSLSFATNKGLNSEITPVISYLEITHSGLTVDKVNLLENGHFSSNPKYIYGKNTYWAKIQLPTNRMVNNKNWFLKVDFPNIDKIEFYTKEKSHQTWKNYNVGDSTKFSDWPVNYRIPTVPLGNNPEDTVYAKITTYSPLIFPLKIIDQDTLYEEITFSNIYYTAIFSMLFVLILSNLFIYLFMKDTSYFYYVLYIAMFSLVQLSTTGLGQQIFWSNFQETTAIALSSIALTNFFLPLFAIHYLSIKETYPKIRKLMILFSAIPLTFIPFLFLENYIFIQNSLHILSFINMSLVLYISIKRTISKDWSAAYMAASYILLFFGISLALFQQNNLIETSFLSQHMMEIAIVFEALLLSIGMAYRVNLIKIKNIALSHEKNTIQKNFYKNLIGAKEKEKSRLGKLLHDGVGHDLLIIKNKLKKLPEHYKVDELTASVNSTAKKIRDISHLFHPFHLEQLGLPMAIENLVNNTLEDTNIDHMVAIESVKLPTEVEFELFYALQELLSNVIKHSHASEVIVRLLKEDNANGASVALYVKDDGVGFDITNNSEGLGHRMIEDNLELFNGKMSIHSSEKQGTEVSVYVPL